MNENNKITDYEINFTQFPFEKNELRSLLSAIDEELHTKQTRKKTNGALKMSIILSSIIGLLTTAAILFTGNNEETVTVAANRLHLPIQKCTESILADTNHAESANEVAAKVNIQPSPSDSRNAAIAVADDEVNTSAKTTIDTKQKTTKEQFPVLFLTDEELSKLNVFKSGYGYAFIAESMYGYGFTQKYKDELKDKNYPTSGIFREVMYLDTIRMNDMYLLPYDGWSMTKSEGVYPYSIYTRYRKGKNFEGSLVSSFGYTPLIIRGKDITYNNEMTALSKKFMNSYIENEASVMANPVIESDLATSPFLDKFIPVFISVGTKECGSQGIIWFPATKHLIDRLPKRFTFIYNSEYYSSKLVEYNPEFNPVPAIMKKSVEQPKFVEKQIGGFENLALTPEELKNIGIEMIDGKVSFIIESRVEVSEVPEEYRNEMMKQLKLQDYDITKPSLLLKNQVLIDTFFIDNLPVRYTGWDYDIYSKTAPMAIALYYEKEAEGTMEPGRVLSSDIRYSDYSPMLGFIKNSESSIDFDGNKKFRSRTEKLLPVTINLGVEDTSTSKISRFGIVSVWFYVNREFAKLLPERYRTPILKELDLLDELGQGKITPEDACEALKGEKSYFDLCKLNTGKIRNFYVNPNPVESTSINISLELTDRSTLSFDLYDLQGKHIENIIPAAEYQPGIINKTANLKVSKGIYMLAATSSAGERSVIKIIL